MKKRLLILSVLFANSNGIAGDPPKLVPRPIPGMAAPTMVKPGTAPAKPVVTKPTVAPLVSTTDRARVLYIHHRAMLPVEFTKNLPTSQQTRATMLNVRESTVKIIPRSEVPKMIIPKP